MPSVLSLVLTPYNKLQFALKGLREAPVEAASLRPGGPGHPGGDPLLDCIMALTPPSPLVGRPAPEVSAGEVEGLSGRPDDRPLTPPPFRTGSCESALS